MKDFVNIPPTMYVVHCKECGTRPIIAWAGDAGYVVKCPTNNHYKTLPGLIDLDDWNSQNKTPVISDYFVALGTIINL